MQKKKINKKIIIAITIIAILLILLLSQNIIQSQNKKRLALSENAPGEAVEVKPNIPVISAGMIPVKLDGEQWIITTTSDPDWYDYSQGKPAYIMLNDGYYRSELERGVEKEQLMQNNVGAKVPDDPQTRGSIYMWIPRFVLDDDTLEEAKYISGIEEPEDGWYVSPLFRYSLGEETKPNFLFTGVWVAKDVDELANINATIEEMNSEDGKYGFIKNTIAIVNIQGWQNHINTYIQKLLVDNETTDTSLITDPTNRNRIILRIIDQNNIDPIKANYTYNRIAGKIDVFVTYSKYGISKVLYEETEELKLTLEDNNRATATTEGIIDLEDGIRTITIIDNKGNKKRINIEVRNCIYATLYDDGTLVFASNNNKIEGKGVTGDYGDISGKTFANVAARPWHSDYTKIKTVEIANKITPASTAYWFFNCMNLTIINSIEKLNTSKVTDMQYMFFGCSSLTNLDLSSFDTSNVTNMSSMFDTCSSLAKLDLSSFDTSSVTTMDSMFYECTSLTELNVSSFNTSKVENMNFMFCECSSLTELDISSFNKNDSNTGSVTDMRSMFRDCTNLTKLTLGDLNTSSVTYMVNMFYNCRNLTELNVSSFNTSNVTNMANIFGHCHGLKELDLRSFDTTNANVLNTFRECVGLTKIHFGENWTKQVNLPEGTDWYSDEGYTNKIALDENRAYTPAGATTIYGKSTIPEGIYVKLYTDGTMTFASHNGKIPGTLVENGDYGDISEKDFNTDAIPWNGVQSKVTTVDILNEISPKTTAGWFSSMSNLTTINNIENINTSNVTDMDWMFANCYSLTNLDVSNFKTDKVTNMAGMFGNCKSLAQLDVSKFDTSEVTDMSNMFYNCYNLKELDLSSFNTSNVTDMRNMFYQCASLSKIHFGGNWKTQVTLPEGTAWYSDEGFTNKIAEGGDNYTPAGEITIYKDVKEGIYVKLYKDGTLAFSSHDINLPGKELQANYGNILGKTYTNTASAPWSGNNNVQTVEFVDEIKPTTTAYWFYQCGNLTTINHIENLNTSNVTNMNCMFFSCKGLTKLDLSSFDTSKVTNMRYMFAYCSGLTNLNVSSFDTSNVTNMEWMFAYFSGLTQLDLSSFDTRKVTNLCMMFYRSSTLRTIYVGENWVISAGVNKSDMFTSCGTSSVTKK